MEQLTPEYLANGKLAAVEEGDGLRQLLVAEVVKPCQRLFVDPAIAGSQQPDFRGRFMFGASSSKLKRPRTRPSDKQASISLRCHASSPIERPFGSGRKSY